MARKKKTRKSKTVQKTKKPSQDQKDLDEQNNGFLSGKETTSLEYLYMVLFLGSIVFGLIYLVGLIMAIIY